MVAVIGAGRRSVGMWSAPATRETGLPPAPSPPLGDLVGIFLQERELANGLANGPRAPGGDGAERTGSNRTGQHQVRGDSSSGAGTLPHTSAVTGGQGVGSSNLPGPTVRHASLHRHQAHFALLPTQGGWTHRHADVPERASYRSPLKPEKRQSAAVRRGVVDAVEAEKASLEHPCLLVPGHVVLYGGIVFFP
jgi:hypothetical protein